MNGTEKLLKDVNSSALSEFDVEIDEMQPESCTGVIFIPTGDKLSGYAGNFSQGCRLVQHFGDGSVLLSGGSAYVGIETLDPAEWSCVGAGDFNGSKIDGLLWLEKSTGNVYIQNNVKDITEVTGKSNVLGVAETGYDIAATGDFFGTGIDGALLTTPAFGDASVSLNIGLAVWARDEGGNMVPGWLGALVNTWDESGALNTLKGDYQSLSGAERNQVINANNYRYEFVGCADFNNDGKDDVMLRNSMPNQVDGENITGAGDVFVFLTDTKENVIAGNRPAEGIVYAGCVTGDWSIAGFGDFDGDGTDDVLLTDGTNLAGWQMANGQRIENFWFGPAGGMEVSGIVDHNGDGTDDIVLSDADQNVRIWQIKDGVIQSSITIA